MSNLAFIVHASLRFQEAQKKAGPVVVTVASEGNKRKMIDGQPLSRLTAYCITHESCVFHADGEKNLIYEANVVLKQRL